MWSQRIRHGWATFTFTLFSLSWGFWKRALCQDSPLYLRASTLIPICWREGEREYHLPPHTYPQLKLQTQTASKTSSDPTFQMGLSPASFKLLPGVACLHLNSLQASWIRSPLYSGLLTSETCFSSHRHLLIPNQPTTVCGLTFSFAPTDLFFIRSPPCLLLSLLAVHCLSPLLASSLSFLSKYQGLHKFLTLVPKHASLFLAILFIFTDSTTTFSVKNTQVPSQVSPSNTRLLGPMTLRTPPPGGPRLQDNWTTSGRVGTGDQWDWNFLSSHDWECFILKSESIYPCPLQVMQKCVRDSDYRGQLTMCQAHSKQASQLWKTKLGLVYSSKGTEPFTKSFQSN